MVDKRNGREERQEGGGLREGKRVKDDKEGKEGRERITPTYVCSALKTARHVLSHRQDSSVLNLVNICFSVNCFPSITAWEHTFVPREYLVPHLEDLFMK